MLYKLFLAMSSGHITDILQSLKQLPVGLAATFFSSATHVIHFGPENRMSSLLNNSKIIIIFKFSTAHSHTFLHSDSTENLQGLSATSCLFSLLFLASLLPHVLV